MGEVSTQFIILVRSLLEGTMFEKKGIKTDFLNGELSHFFLEIRNNFLKIVLGFLTMIFLEIFKHCKKRKGDL